MVKELNKYDKRYKNYGSVETKFTTYKHSEHMNKKQTNMPYQNFQPSNMMIG